MPCFLKTLNTNPKTTHTKCKTLIYPAKGNFAFKTVLCHLKRVLCFLMTNTDHYMSRHSKHRLNTDVLNGKHYYEWENTSMKALSGALCFFMFSVTVCLLL